MALVIESFNRVLCGHRFFFQGTGASDFSNSDYGSLINVKKIRKADVPGEIIRSVALQREDQRATEARLFQMDLPLLRCTGFFGIEAQFLPFVSDMSTTSISGNLLPITATKLTGAFHGTVYVQQDQKGGGAYTIILRFYFYKINHLPETSREYQRSLDVALLSSRRESTSAGQSSMSFICIRHLEVTEGMPCLHETRAIAQYRDYSTTYRDIRTAL